jgi:hypothetical protein
MKAVLALVIIYIGTFLVAIQGASQNPVEAAPQSASPAQATPAIDPAKEADIRSLMELIGTRDAIQESTGKGIEQFRENLVATVPNNDRGQQFVNTFVQEYQKKFNPDDVADQLVAIYDRHFTEDEIKGLLEFYGSPLGQKYAAEMSKISPEAQAVGRQVSTRVAKDVLQDLRKQYPGVGGQARLVRPRAAQSDQAKQQNQTQPQSQLSASQP